ncbi:MAG: ATP-dependent RecD-like DNA helicase [Hespellia sp.]|nr:ATP-dependent RecD-like DNA helicase [Hespellia sp.]
MRSRFKKKIYRNEESDYCIAVFTTADQTVPQKARCRDDGKEIEFVAIGYGFPFEECLEVEMVGKWITNSQHGQQFEVESFMEVIPRTREGIVGYLSSGALKGIGPKTAETIFSYFGMETLEVMEKDPQQLLKVRGINERKLQEIVDAFGKNKTFRELMTFLAPYKVSPKKVQKILLEFGSEAPDIIRHRPYRLCAVKGFGFLTVDQIARQYGASLQDPMRISGCIAYVLKETSKEGHLYLEQDILASKVLETLNQNLPQPAVGERQVQDILYRLVMQKSIVVEQNRIYETSFYDKESQTADMVVDHLLDQMPSYDIEALLQKAQQELGIELSETQCQAVRMVFLHPISIITGGPGTGKTTVLKVILYVYKHLETNEVQLMAPTGRAARRMVESTGEENASTMHMALGLVGNAESYTEFEYLDAKFFNLDECSMIDMNLGYEFFRHLPLGVRMVLIGDVDQLPSVGAGDVFRQLIKSGLIPVVTLNLVYRQGIESRIPKNAKRIKENVAKLDYGDDFEFLEAKGAEETARIVRRVYARELQQYDVDSVQVLTPYRVRGAASVNSLNDTLREIVNPQISGMTEMTIQGNVFRPGDKVLQNKNTELVSNGDIGCIQNFYLDEEGEGKAGLLFSENRQVTYGEEQMENVELAYATTVHKSQGSEYPVVILPWIRGFYGMLKRNILYTAITRAKVKLIIVGEKAALYQAIHTDDSGKRNTALAEKICSRYQIRTGTMQPGAYGQLKLVI